MSVSVILNKPIIYTVSRAHHYPVSQVHTSSSVRSMFQKWMANSREKRKRAYEESKEEWMRREKDAWSGYSQELAKYSQRKREAMRQVQEMTELEERVRREEQEDAVRQELLKRMEKAPKDTLDEEYFKDWKRFDKYQDNRDPLFRGVDDKGSDDWREIMREKLQETRDNYHQMKAGLLHFKLADPNWFKMANLISLQK